MRSLKRIRQFCFFELIIVSLSTLVFMIQPEAVSANSGSRRPVVAFAQSTPTPTSKPKPTIQPTKTLTSTQPVQTNKAAQATTPNRCGDRSKLSKEMHFYTYTDYMDAKILDQFVAECGVKVSMDTFTSMEEALAKISDNNSQYDMVILTDFAVKLAVVRELIAPLDKTLIPNIKNLNKTTMSMFYDTKNRYSLPYQWGTTGLAYHVASFPEGPPKSWSVLFDPDQLCKVKGKATLLDNVREAPGAALVYLGFPWSSTNEEAHAAVRKLMSEQKECLAGYDSQDNFRRLASGELVVAEAWSYAGAFAYIDNPDIQFVIPKEGGLLWQDNMVITRKSPNKYTAHIFINYLLDPQIGATLTEFTYTFTPNLAAEPFLTAEYHKVVDNSGIKVTNEVLKRLQFNVRNEYDSIFADTWAEVKDE